MAGGAICGSSHGFITDGPGKGSPQQREGIVRLGRLLYLEVASTGRRGGAFGETTRQIREETLVRLDHPVQRLARAWDEGEQQIGCSEQRARKGSLRRPLSPAFTCHAPAQGRLMHQQCGEGAVLISLTRERRSWT